MIGVTQTIFLGDPRDIPGNCLQAAVATLLALPLRVVPHFVQFPSWEDDLRWYVRCHGWEMHDVQTRPHYGLMFGRTERSDTEAHAVAVSGGQIWDPHPSRAGLTRPLRFLAWTPHRDVMTRRSPGEALNGT